MAYQIETTCICGDPETSKNHSFGAVSVPIYQTAILLTRVLGNRPVIIIRVRATRPETSWKRLFRRWKERLIPLPAHPVWRRSR